MPYNILIKKATNCEPPESPALDDKNQPFSVRELRNTKEFYITEYACASNTGWCEFVPGDTPDKDDYEPIIRINDICVLNGTKILYTRKSSLDKVILDMLCENAKKASID
jgi:hypothetical protein